MINLLIANRDLQNLTSLQNCISQYIPDIRVGYIATSGKEVLNILNKEHFDLILIDSNIPFQDGFEILDKLSAIKKIEYYKSFIFLARTENVVKNLKKHDQVYDSLLDDGTMNKIIITLKKVIKERDTNSNTSCVKNKIINELQNIGFNLSHKGTHYLAESMVLIATLNYNADNLSKNIYPKVSEIYRRNLNNIKCNITSATEAACKNITPKMLEEYFRLSGKIKPTTKMIIYSVLQRI